MLPRPYQIPVLLVLAFVVFPLSLALSMPGWLHMAAFALVADDPLPARADLIAVAGGKVSTRQIEAAFLYKRGLAPRVLATSQHKNDYLQAYGIRDTEAEASAKLLRHYGVPRNRIIVLNEGTSTYGEAVATKTYMMTHGMHRLIVVSSLFHTARLRWIYRRVFSKSGLSVYVHPAYDSTLLYWWAHEQSLLSVYEEYLKFAFYGLRYGLGWNPDHVPGAPQVKLCH